MLGEGLLRDLRHATGMFLHSPVFTTVAVLSLAVGLGANAALLTLVNSLLLKPLPYRQPQNLVRLTGVYPRAAISYFQGRSRTMEISGVGLPMQMNLKGLAAPARVLGSAVSVNFLAVLGARLERGRGFRSWEDQPGRDNVAVISHATWLSLFHHDPGVIGRVIFLDGTPRQIVGVASNELAYPSASVQIWYPMTMDATNFLEYWGAPFMQLISRLNSAESMGAARLEIRELLVAFRRTFPYPMSRDWNAHVSAVPLQEDLIGDFQSKLLIVFASALIVLFIACANIANILLVRFTSRRREMAIRLALGAERARLWQQSITEALMLSGVGALGGLFLGNTLLPVCKLLLAASTPGLVDAQIGWTASAEILCLALVVGILFGLAPALHIADVKLVEAMKTGGQKGTSGVWTRVRSSMVAIEVALAFVLLASAGLLLRSMNHLTATNPGFETAHLFSIQIGTGTEACRNRTVCISATNRLIASVRQLPQVKNAAMASVVPLDGQLPTVAVDVEGHPTTAEHPAAVLAVSATTPDYFQLMQIPLLAGRFIAGSDGPDAAPVSLISAAAARHFWPGENAVGKHIKSTGSSRWRTIIGVVGDVKQYSLTAGLPDWVPGSIYIPFAQASQQDQDTPLGMNLLVSTGYDSPELAAVLHRITAEVYSGASVSPAESVTQMIRRSFRPLTTVMSLFGSFAVIATALASIGIYGIMAQSVEQRAYEIGVRIAIGATRRRIIEMVLRSGLLTAASGLLAGVLGAVSCTRVLRSLLFGIGATDFPTTAGVTIFLTAVAVLAGTLPAWRASQIPPTRSLRNE